MILSLIISLVLTIIIEVSTSAFIGVKNKEDIKVITWTNILTNPVVVYLSICIKFLNNDLVYNLSVIMMEVIVVIIESIIYKKCLVFKAKSPMFISSINNITSFLLGVIINKI